jgi:hypothetical protein
LFFAHFVILFSLKKLFGAPHTGTIVPIAWRRNVRLRPSSAAFLCYRCAGTKKGREFDPRPLYNRKGDTRATNATIQ